MKREKIMGILLICFVLVASLYYFSGRKLFLKEGEFYRSQNVEIYKDTPFGQDFSNPQGVKVYAQNGFANFSTNKYHRNIFTRITHTDRNLRTAIQQPVYLYHYEQRVVAGTYKNPNGLGVSFLPKN